MDKKRLRVKFERRKCEFELVNIVKRRGFKPNLTLSGCGFGRVKFEAKFDFKFERKKLGRSIFAFRRGRFKFYDGSYLVGSDRVKFKSNDV